MDNVSIVRRLEEAYGKADYDTVRELISPDFVPHTPASEMMPPGVEGCVAADQGTWMSFPDKKSEILDIFGERDKVVAHVRMTGTNRGGLPWAGIPANDAKIDTDWVQISRHDADGKLVETWSQMDVPKMMVQLGAMPAPGGM